MGPGEPRQQGSASARSSSSAARRNSAWERSRGRSDAGSTLAVGGAGSLRVQGLRHRVAVVPEGWVPWPLLPARDWEAVDLVVKRAIDLVLGSVLLVLSSPLIAVSALLVKLTSPGPAFFLHTRKGRTEEDIRVVKLRTMVEEAEEMHDEVASRSNGSVFETVEDDPRVTAVGAWLRKLSIDELPQLVNVLRGEMSLVGPRPLVEDEVRRLPIRHRWARARCKPGLTCIWQISGRNACPDRRRLALDQRYVNEWSLWLDVKILLLTVPAVIFGRGAM